MKKIKFIVILLALIGFILPSTINAKGNENSRHNRIEEIPENSNSSLKEKKVHPEQSNAIFTRDYTVSTEGVDGAGTVVIEDSNEVFDFATSDDQLSNGDTFTVEAVNKGGNTVKEFEYETGGLIDVWDGFDYVFTGFNSEGVLVITDTNMYVEYFASISYDLSNGMYVTVDAHPNGNPLPLDTQMIEVVGLDEIWDTFTYTIEKFNEFASFSFDESNMYVFYEADFGVLIDGELKYMDSFVVNAYREGTLVLLDTMVIDVPELPEIWDGFTYEITGLNGEGVFTATDTNLLVYYEPMDATDLSNGDEVIVVAYDEETLEVIGLPLTITVDGFLDPTP